MAAILILVAKDETLLHDPIEEALTEGGFELVIAGSGTEAISELEADAARFEALITDIKLGRGPNGWDVAHRARQLVPTMPVVYMSGDSAEDWLANGVPKSIMMQKPFALAQLVTAVSQLLNEKPLIG